MVLEENILIWGEKRGAGVREVMQGGGRGGGRGWCMRGGCKVSGGCSGEIVEEGGGDWG